jgi:hypothetical protein
MQQIFIELYNYRPAWAKCSESERTDFAKKVVEAVKGLKSAGVDVIAYGGNSPKKQTAQFIIGISILKEISGIRTFLRRDQACL